MTGQDQPGKEDANSARASMTEDAREPGQEHGESAKGRVLGSPDLLERILLQLPTPRLRFLMDRHRVYSKLKIEHRDRWFAAHVNQHIRQAALRLPWEVVEWGMFRAGASFDKFKPICRARNVVTLTHSVSRETVALAASLLGYAGSLASLCVVCDSEDTLLRWLQHPHLLSPWHGVPAVDPAHSTPVLAGLSSLTHLSLSVTSTPWRDVAWLTALQRLKNVELVEYGGPSLAGLPHLQTACIDYYSVLKVNVALEQWASPRLTALSLRDCCVSLRSASSSIPVQDPDADTHKPRTWLRGLRRLNLSWCCVSLQNLGLRELVPGLTCLEMSSAIKEHGASFHAVVSKGLPINLQELALTYCDGSIPKRLPANLKKLDLDYSVGGIPDGLWVAISELSSLVYLRVQHWGKVSMSNFAAATDCLYSLARLKNARFCFFVVKGVGLRERIRDVESLLHARGGVFKMYTSNLQKAPEGADAAAAYAGA